MTLMSHLLAGVAMTPMERVAGRYMRAPDHPAGDEFANAFDAAAAADDEAPGAPPPTETPSTETPPTETPPAETPPTETPPTETPPAEGAETPPAETPPTETPPAEGAETPPATPPAETPPPPAPAAPTAEEIVKGLAEALKAQPPAPPPAPSSDTPPASQPEQPPLYSTEELEVLGDYEKNWPDVAKAEALKRRAEYHDLMAFMFKSVHDYLQPHLAQLGAVGNVMHEQQLRQAVPDYTPDLETAVAGWIESQPTYLQAPMKQVMQGGTSEEVADLIGRYRAATGAQPAPAPTPASSPPATTPKTELSSAAKQAAESLAPVSGDRSAVPQGDDPGDFKTAFQRFAAEADAT